MAEFFQSIGSFFEALFHAIGGDIGILSSILDIAIVAVIIYNVIKIVRETRAGTLVKGMLILGVCYVLAFYLKLQTLTFILDNLSKVLVFGLIVIFQPEIRRALEQLGRTRLNKIKILGVGGVLSEEDVMQRIQRTIDAICKSVKVLQGQRMGALIVFERDIKLVDIVKTGTVINAEASPELIGNIFFVKAPLHDGAMIIRDGYVCAAGCILPLSQNSEISSELGTRHRAALGMSENSDAVVVVVSEETTAISIAYKGFLMRDVSIDVLKETLQKRLIHDVVGDGTSEKSPFWKGRSK
ncbi:DNA integrity scanning protein DisA [Eubacteriaceae bacterium CHKCI005]|nr:DNA integrity scanning protein DisA [Eubacteriaceae bacterium CHKCI005]